MLLQDSKGARIELQTAESLGHKIYLFETDPEVRLVSFHSEDKGDGRQRQT